MVLMDVGDGVDSAVKQTHSHERLFWTISIAYIISLEINAIVFVYDDFSRMLNIKFTFLSFYRRTRIPHVEHVSLLLY